MIQLQNVICTPEITRLGPAQVSAAAATLVQAFHDDPLYVALFPAEQAHNLPLAPLWHALMKYHLLFGEVYTTPHINGTAAWLPPGKTSYTVWRMLRSGLVWAMMQFPVVARRYAIKVMTELEEVHTRLMPQPHWYLSVLGVAPACQGQGLGSALLKPVLEKADATNMPCYLEAVTEKNVAFYQKRGFEVVCKTERKDVAVMTWGMMWKP